MTNDEIGTAIVDAAYNVHCELGPGLLENCYEVCLAYELEQRGFVVKRQEVIPIRYKDVVLDAGYRADLIVENKVVVELKACEEINNIHQAQLLTYMRLGHFSLGYLINFNVKLIKDGMRRFIL